eukprot:CAMPEP_0174753764 /NCGR_PEP_ID=MMETSP1094-20130205/104684_1 /TAXON_ID=156173 /ORGANISM="Chrysochromulina brevifilum, Strain UTEX LB 985" /LENGTH=72 /DNA_ID=CAMNT_0015959577 /DNA_START=124 /DNA_END=342 /DNA_ORIENTATION=+
MAARAVIANMLTPEDVYAMASARHGIVIIAGNNSSGLLDVDADARWSIILVESCAVGRKRQRGPVSDIDHLA